MAQVSKYPISKNIGDRIFDVFIKSLIKVRSAEDAQNLASDLFSPIEKIMFAKRLSIAFLLMKGYQYREINKLLRVSLTTIASVNRSLNYGSNGYRTILDRISKEERLEDFFSSIAEKFVSIPATGGQGSGAWRYFKKEMQKSRANKLREF